MLSLCCGRVEELGMDPALLADRSRGDGESVIPTAAGGGCGWS